MLDVSGLGDFAADASFGLEFWFTNRNCTGNVYEYLYSHQQAASASPLEPTNSNMNLYLSCDPAASSLNAGFVRLILVDSDPVSGLGERAGTSR